MVLVSQQVTLWRLGKKRGGRGGATPYGFRSRLDPLVGERVLEADPVESDRVRLIFRLYLRLKSLEGLCKQMLQEGVSTRSGRRWSRAALGYLLSNKAYLGRLGRCPRIVAPIVFYKVQKQKQRNVKRRSPETALTAPGAER